MPVDVTVEEPLRCALAKRSGPSLGNVTHYTRVVGLETDDEVALRPDHKGITTHRCSRERSVVTRIPEACVLFAPPDSLEVVP